MEAISKAISKNRSLFVVWIYSGVPLLTLHDSTSENAHLFYGAENTTLTLYDATSKSYTHVLVPELMILTRTFT